MGKMMMTNKDRMTASVRDVLLRHWDPIGILDEPAAQDEYDAYAPVIASMLRAGAKADALARHLLSIERDRMGLPGDLTRAARIAGELASITR
jgi:hypothetical protein